MSPTSVGGGYRTGVQTVSISSARDAWASSKCKAFATSLVETPLMKLIFSTNEKINFELGHYNGKFPV